MAASGSTPSVSIASTTVPEDFHYETKYIVLSYLGMLPVKSRGQATGQGDAETDRERSSLIKADIGEALRQLEDEITSSFSTTGFDRRSSLVFNPASPESSVEDCLAAAGDRVAKELDTRLAQVVGELLSGPLDYQRFRDATLSLSAHTQEGWNKVLVPLVLLQALQSEGQSLATLLQLGLRFLEENESDFILQQGGWSDVFRLQPEDHQGVTIAEDSNDIYILSGEQHPEQPSPPSSLLCAGDTSSEQSSWQTESLPASLAGHESWAQVGGMDPEDAKSLDSAEGGALAEERSENNSSNSDIVHVEREEAELLEEAGEVEAIDESMMSVLGTESELAQLREELQEHAPPAPGSTEATEPASLLSLEEPGTVETVSVSLSAEPSLVTSEPELLLLPSLVTSEPELLLPPGSDAAETSSVEPEPAVPPSAPAMEPEPEPEPEQEAEPAVAPVPEAAEAAPPSLAKETAAAPAELEATSEPAPEPKVEPVSLPPHSDPETVAEPEVPQAVASVTEVPVEAPSAEPSVQTESAPEFQLLLYGGATLAALAAVILYSVVSYRRK